MKIPTKRKLGSVPLHKSDSFIGKTYFQKCCVIKIESAQDIFKDIRKNEERNNNI